MKYCLGMAVVVMGLSACSGLNKPQEKIAHEQGQQAGLAVVAKSHFDITYISSAVNFSQYKKIKWDALDLSAVNIIKPSTHNTFQEPWELNAKDKAYYQERYADAVQKSLIDSGLYVATTETDTTTLLLNAKIIQIAPLASKDDFKGRPNLMKVYSEGFGRMTIAFAVYDSVSNKLIATATDEHDLGSIWEENNRTQNNIQIRLAFDYWLNKLKTELEAVMGK